MSAMATGICDLCWLLCCPPWPSKIAQKIAFQPPPPSYSFLSETGKCRIIFSDDPICYAEWEKHSTDCLFATSSRGNKIACIYVKCTARPKYTILFSHGNASDIGQMFPFYASLGTLMGCNIFSYDYSGYGASSGKPSEKNMYADIECAWRTMQSRYDIPAERIILYGMSLGTVPTVDLAARFKVGAVILHSALSSAIRVIKPNTKRTWCWDAFTTIEKVSKITDPVLVIHGTEDEIIPFSHGVAIYEKCQRGVSPLWVGGAGHNNIECRSQYLERLKLFVNGELDQFRESTVRNISEPENNDGKKTTKNENKNENMAEIDKKYIRIEYKPSTSKQMAEKDNTNVKTSKENNEGTTDEEGSGKGGMRLMVNMSEPRTNFTL